MSLPNNIEVSPNRASSIPHSGDSVFDHHGSLVDMVLLINDDESSLDFIIKNLPKRAKELEEISKQNPNSERMFFALVRQSFRYLQIIIDLQNEKDISGIGSEEEKYKNDLRGRCHNATISSINSWSKSLHHAGIDNSFLSVVLSTPPNRAVYGMFAIGLALDIYTDESFDIEKYAL